jgi:hypothetical protein
VTAPTLFEPLDPATPAAVVRGGSLLRSEWRRLRSRRFIQLLLVLALLGWLVAVAIGLTHFARPSAADLASARQVATQTVAEAKVNREQCLKDTSRPQNIPAEQICGPPVRASDFSPTAFLPREPFALAEQGTSGALGFGAVAAVLAFLIGATWIGAEWSSRSIVALLFWEPRRLRVVGAKVGVLVGAAAVLGVLAQAAWLGMAGILNAVAGMGDALPGGFWSQLLALQGRGVLLTVLAALVGFGLANLTRNTGAALGVGFVYFAIVETAVRILRPTWQPWLLSNDAVALMYPGGLSIYINDGAQGHEYVIHNLPAGITLACVTAVVVGAGAVLFARRDLH